MELDKEINHYYTQHITGLIRSRNRMNNLGNNFHIVITGFGKYDNKSIDYKYWMENEGVYNKMENGEFSQGHYLTNTINLSDSEYKKIKRNMNIDNILKENEDLNI